ncbi:MAG: D-hexose-6-phosphate mutarotase [Pseudomonadota bacterium]
MTTNPIIRFGQLPAVHLQAPDGAEATITLFGAHVVSWRPASGSEQLFCASQAVLDGSKAIRGGIPVIFPQFAARGDGLRHGFARVSEWQVEQNGVANGVSFAEFSLTSAGSSAPNWPHEFALLLRVAVHAEQLQLSLRVRNTGAHPFSFAAAFHTYFKVEEFSACAIKGLHDMAYADHTVTPTQAAHQAEVLLHTTAALDRVYHQIPGDLELLQKVNSLILQQEGFCDAVIWNPGNVALADLAQDDYRHFICIEAAMIDPYWLKAGEEWCGLHSMRSATIDNNCAA